VGQDAVKDLGCSPCTCLVADCVDSHDITRKHTDMHIRCVVCLASAIPHFPLASTFSSTPLFMGSLMIILDLLVLISFLATFFAIREYQRRGGLPYPPGPRPLPFIGNFFDIPKDFSWLSYTQLSKKHGMNHSLVQFLRQKRWQGTSFLFDFSAKPLSY